MPAHPAVAHTAKNIVWTEGKDVALLIIVNSLGAHTAVGHRQKCPAFAKLSEECLASSVFSDIARLLTGKKCADHFDKLVKDHCCQRKAKDNMTGTDDESFMQKTILMDDLCEILDDARDPAPDGGEVEEAGGV